MPGQAAVHLSLLGINRVAVAYLQQLRAEGIVSGSCRNPPVFVGGPCQAAVLGAGAGRAVAESLRELAAISLAAGEQGAPEGEKDDALMDSTH